MEKNHRPTRKLFHWGDYFLGCNLSFLERGYPYYMPLKEKNMSNLPVNFDYDNCLDMIKISIEEILIFLKSGRIADAKTRCERNLLAIERLKKNASNSRSSS